MEPNFCRTSLGSRNGIQSCRPARQLWGCPPGGENVDALGGMFRVPKGDIIISTAARSARQGGGGRMFGREARWAPPQRGNANRCSKLFAHTPPQITATCLFRMLLALACLSIAGTLHSCFKHSVFMSTPSARQAQ
eukprot:gene23036-biopygen8824